MSEEEPVPAADPPGRPSGFAEALTAGPLVLDGGMSNQLADAGHDLADALWSARLLADDPEAIVRAHQAYFEAGAVVAITAGYQASFEGFARRGIDRAGTERLLRLSVELAREAARRTETARRTERARRAGAAGEPTAAHRVGAPPRARATGPLWVAASVGPYGAVLADGSEYRGRYGLDAAALEAFHRPRLEVLAEAGPDVLALETIPDTDEARALLRAVRGLGVPAWLSYSVAGDRTRAGQPLAEAFALAADAPEVVAVGVNCCSPADADAAVALAARITGKPVVVYPNSGERWDPTARNWRGEPTFGGSGAASRGRGGSRADARGRVAGWLADGARLVGGCCRVGPREIAELADEVALIAGRETDGPAARRDRRGPE
ncbi:homocysteine S-methyltransferase [Kitasatospora sp. NPDC057015]|uniref:homocysteine S-methyltransferase n=1 Tax=Kitasatospora sp. NPDC057015 TaxID=3346001 RepID=UPI00363DF9C5